MKNIPTINTIYYPAEGHPVEKTTARFLQSKFASAKTSTSSGLPNDGFRVGIQASTWQFKDINIPSGVSSWIWIRLDCERKW